MIEITTSSSINVKPPRANDRALTTHGKGPRSETAVDSEYTS